MAKGGRPDGRAAVRSYAAITHVIVIGASCGQRSGMKGRSKVAQTHRVPLKNLITRLQGALCVAAELAMAAAAAAAAQ